MNSTLPFSNQRKLSLSVEDIWVRRGENVILKGVTLDAHPGELVAIVGPNGSGKTTLLTAIAGERPTAGDVMLYDHSRPKSRQSLYAAPERWLEQIGYVPVDNVLHDQLTVREALTYVARLRQRDYTREELDDRINRLLKDFDIDEELQNRPIKKISSGESKKVNICAELLTDPPVLLLDEPTSNLDPNNELELMRNLRKLARSGKTVLIVTHTLDTVGLCNRIAFLSNGQLIALSPPATILRDVAREAQEAIPHTPSRNPSFDHWVDLFAAKYREKAQETPAPPSPMDKNRRQPYVSFSRQISVLVGRYFRVRSNDWKALLGTLALGLVAGFLLFVLPTQAFVPPNLGEASSRGAAARQAMFMIALCVTIIGMLASFHEISKEMRIYRHERLKGLSPVAYMLSKWVWLVGAVGIIAPLMLLSMTGLPLARNATVWIALILATMGILASIIQAIRDRLWFALILLILSAIMSPVSLDTLGIPPLESLSVSIAVTLAYIGIPISIVEGVRAVLRRRSYRLSTQGQRTTASSILRQTADTANDKRKRANRGKRWRRQLLVRLTAAAIVLVAGSGWLSLTQQQIPGRPIAETWVEILLIVMLTSTCIAAISLGLAVSAVAGEDNHANTLIIVVVLIQILLSGLLKPAAFSKLIDTLSYIAVTRWAMIGLSSSLGLYCWRTEKLFEDFNSTGHLLSVGLFLALYALLSCAGTVAALRMRDAWATRAARLRASLFSLSIGKLTFAGAFICLLSWAIFLNQQSMKYHELTFSDSNYGGMRFARVDAIGSINPLQYGMGQISQSFCAAPIQSSLPPSPTPLPIIDMPTVTPPLTTALPTPVPSIVVSPTFSDVTTPTPSLYPETAVASPLPPTATFIPTPEPRPFPDLSGNTTEVDTQLFYQPNGTVVLQTIPANVTLAVLGKNEAGTWYRVLWSGMIGWVMSGALVEHQRAQETFAPPPCAIPRAYIDVLDASWTSDVSGQIGVVVDLYRSEYGSQFPRSDFQSRINGIIQVDKTLLVGTQGRFLISNVPLGLEIEEGDQISFALQTTSDESLSLFVTIFSVPSGCTFESRGIP